MKSTRIFHAAVVAGATLALTSCLDRTVGTSDEHETNLARVYQNNGAPAARAKVKFYRAEDTAKMPVLQVYADESGTYEVPTLPAGYYNAVATDGSGKASLIDSILFTGGPNTSMPSDTLRPVGVLTGILEVEPQHSPRIAWVQVMGAGVAANVDSLGKFRLEVPAGRLTLAALTREAQYTPTFRAVRSYSDSTVDLGSIRLEYTGIPAVTGLRALYDDRTGVVTVTWNRSISRAVSGYRLDVAGEFRQLPTGDTVIYDTLFSSNKFDSVAKTRSYSVVARDTNYRFGDPWKRIEVVGVSPFSVSRAAVRWDSIGTMPAGCTGLDTLQGMFVCMERWKGSERAVGEYDAFQDMLDADTLRVWTSRDGVSWVRQPGVWKDVMRAVFWRGRLWTVQGGDSVETRREGVQGPFVFEYTLYGVAIVSAWDLAGVRKSVDTIRQGSPRGGFRLEVDRDRLLLSADSANLQAYGPAPLGLWPWIQGSWSKPNPDQPWVAQGVDQYPWEWSRLMRYMSRNPYWEVPDLSASASSDTLAGMRLALEPNGILFLKESANLFPWTTSPEHVALKPLFKYRGNGQTVPAGLPYQGGRVFFDWNGGIWKLSPKS